MTVSKQFAAFLSKAAEIRESSWDEEAFQRAKPLEKKYHDFYRVSIYSASQMACKEEPQILPMVFVLLENYYQQSVDWAKAQT